MRKIIFLLAFLIFAFAANAQSCTSNATCTNPRTYCNGMTLITEALPGSCVSGACVYPSSQTSCAAMSGWVNTSEPAPACNAGQACTAQQQEYHNYICASNHCAYTIDQLRTSYTNCTQCALGCSGGQCNPDPCNGVQCVAATCNGTVRSYGGFCASGSCAFNATEDCATRSGWVNNGSATPCCSSGRAAQCQPQNYYNYTCAIGECAFNVTGARIAPLNSTQCVTRQSVCLNATTLRNYTASQCANATCSNIFNDVNCVAGCLRNKCRPEACLGLVCDTPPQPQCLGDYLVTYNSTGTCNDYGNCTYPSQTTWCQFGCAETACRTEPVPVIPPPLRTYIPPPVAPAPPAPLPQEPEYSTPLPPITQGMLTTGINHHDVVVFLQDKVPIYDIEGIYIRAEDTPRPYYEIQAYIHSKILGIWDTPMKISIFYDPINGRMMNVVKPFWAFLAW